jgi:hypothetical protein
VIPPRFRTIGLQGSNFCRWRVAFEN